MLITGEIEEVYLVDTGSACGDIVISRGKIIDCDPIFYELFIGRASGTVRQIIRNNGWSMIQVQKTT